MELKIRKIRDSLGIDGPELAKRTGISKAVIWNYETGRTTNIDPEDLCKIADALDVSLDMLVRGKEKDRPKGRSTEDLLKMFRDMSEDELNLWTATIQAVLADKRFQAHLRQVGQANP